MAVDTQFILISSHSSELASSWIYLVDWILALILGVAFVFYFGRLLGIIISTLCRIFLWRSWNVMINIESIRFSLLGGRIMLKNLTIGTQNQTISILKVNFTWRYWLLGVTRLPDYLNEGQTDEEIETKRLENEKLPSRFLLSLEGLEIFMYNRTFAYDNIMEVLAAQNASKESADSDTEEKKGTGLRQRSNRSNQLNSFDINEKSDELTIENEEVDIAKVYQRLARILLAFPISIAIKKAVLVMGNYKTPSLLIHSCKSAIGLVDVRKPKDLSDIYKQLYFFELEKLQTLIRPNILYEETQKEDQNEKKTKHVDPVSKFKKLQNKLNVIPLIYLKLMRRKDSTHIEYQNWIGLRRYLNDSIDDFNYLYDSLSHRDEQYAKYSMILETQYAKLTYFYDVPGKVSLDNMDSYPEYGADIELSMATIYYGPWADKQRVPIQQVFFPPIARDSQPSPKPVVGQLRQYEGFKANIFTNDEIIFRIPTREPSKDKEVLQNTRSASNVKLLRPFGWLELKMGPNSSVSSFTSFLCLKERGYPNTLSAIFVDLELRSSVNHDILCTADFHTIDSKVGFPLEWNGPCEWNFDNLSSNAKIFFLREHELLISDMLTDFGSGTPPPYEQFRPFTHVFNWKFQNYELYLNVNDSNIINNPLDFNSNKYLTFRGEELKVHVDIPLMTQVTRLTCVSFDLFVPSIELTLDSPPWHTMNSFAKSSLLIGVAKNLTLDGSYTYLSTVEVNTSNNMILRFKGDDIMVKFYGSLVKDLFIIRENYLGDHLHFKTFEEYNDEVHLSGDNDSTNSPETMNEPFDYWKLVKTVNNLDILFSFQVRNGLMVLPHDLYTCQSHIGLSFDYFDMDIRFTNFFMDLQADFSPISGKFVDFESEADINKLTDIQSYLEEFEVRSTPDLFWDDLTIHGHRMFGLPPDEITYWGNWRLGSGPINIHSQPVFVVRLLESVGTFLASFKDLENALHPNLPTIYNIICVSFFAPEITIELACQEKSVVVILKSLLMGFNDIANKRYSNRLSVNIPEIIHKVIENDTQRLHALFKTSLLFEIITKKPKCDEFRMLQQEHIRYNDAPHHRASHLLFGENKDANYNEAYCSIISPVTLIDVPLPLNRWTEKINGAESSMSLHSSSGSDLDNAVQFQDGKLYMSPSLRYNDQDFSPESQNDSKIKYDNFIITLGDVIGFVSPRALEVYAMFHELLLERDFNHLMDYFEKQTTKSLKLLMLQVCMNDVFRVVAPSVDISFGDLCGNTEVEILESLKLSPAINILISELSIALSELVVRNKIREESGELKYTMETSNSLACSLKSVLVNIISPADFENPISISLKDIELWNSNDSHSDILSYTTDDCGLSINEGQAKWLVNYYFNTMEELKPSLDRLRRCSQIKERSVAALIYLLSTASKDFKIDHDPAVLTKPAHVIRSLPEHLRKFDTWKVLVRFRHILQSLDKNWLTEQQKSLNETNWSIPTLAHRETWEVFSDWRSWESNYREREDFFQKVFRINPVAEKTNISQLLFNHIGVELNNSVLDLTDYINFDNINISFLRHNAEAVFLRFDNEIEDHFDAKTNTLQLLVNLGSYSGKITDDLIMSIPSIIEEIESNMAKTDSEVQVNKKEEKDNERQKSKNESQGLSIIFNVNEFQQNVYLDKMSLVLHSKNFNLSGLTQNFESFLFASYIMKLSMLQVKLNINENQIFKSTSEGLNFVSGNANTADHTYMLDATIAKSSIDVHDDKLHESVLTVLEQEAKYSKIFAQDKRETRNTNRDLLELLYKFDVTINLQVNHFNYLIDALIPLIFGGSIYDNSFSLILTEGIFDISSLIQKLDFNLKSKSSGAIFDIENSQVFNTLKICEMKGAPVIVCDSQIGFTKVFTPKLIKCIDDIIEQYPELKEYYRQLYDMMKEYNDKKTDKQLINSNASKSQRGEAGNLNWKDTLLELKFSNDYIGISFLEDRSRYSLEVEDAGFNLSNLPDTPTQSAIEPYSGSLLISSLRVSIADRSIPIGLSNLMDINMTIKLINEKLKASQILEIISQYSRICLSLGVIKRIVHLTDELSLIGKKLNRILESDFKKESTPEPQRSQFNMFSKISGFHVLSYKSCIGWIFENARNDYPGLIFGAERFYAVTNEKMGKVSLIETYLAVAHGSNSSGFYGTQSETGSINRALLPFMQFIYIITEDKDGRNMKMTLNGDELHVNYLSNALHILEHSVKSASRIQEFFEKRVRPIDKWKDDSKTNEEQQIDYMNSLRSTFSSMELKATFAGSNVSLQKVGHTEEGGSILLHFPAVKSVTTYIHDKIGSKKHTIKSELFTSSSDNKLYASCVPVIVDIVEGVKQMLKLQNQNRAVSNKQNSIDNQKNFNISSLLEETDFHFGIKIDKQRLAFSCEPTAKVEAIVGIDGINLQLNSGSGASINFLGVLHSVSASLQHVYSREVSGSILVKTVMLNTNIDCVNEIDIRSANSISDVEGYVNIKQYQDLALFRDIWYPKDLSRRSEEPHNVSSEELATNKSIATRFKEVSTTNAVPWFITFVLTNVSIKMNCGPSIGVMFLNLNQLWVVSHKTLDWTQQYKLGIDTLQVSSEGRLGGEFVCSDIYIHSEITWKLESGEVLDVPLILVSAGIDRLTTKSTFDYHVFTVINIEDFSIDVFNQKSELMISKDHLFVSAQFKNCEIYMTSFTASNVLDIYNAILRLTQDNKISYKETLSDSSKTKFRRPASEDKLINNAILETVKKLETEFEVVAGTLLIHVYPSSFDDPKVLVVKLDESSANFMQNEYNDGIANQLEIEFNDLTVSLSTNITVPEEFIQDVGVDEFIKHAHKARGGNIFLFPSFLISMAAFQKYNSNLIEYIYKSTFGGTVDVKWNLGSVNFIREMYTIHKNSLQSRTEFKNTLKNSNLSQNIEFNENMFKDKKDDRPLKMSLVDAKNAVSTEKIDKALNEKIDKVSKDSKYIYLPLAPPIIQAPQLKELGNATPPLEWFGLHRNKFPNVTHELGIVGLQKVIHHVESEYSRLLGRA